MLDELQAALDATKRLTEALDALYVARARMLRRQHAFAPLLRKLSYRIEAHAGHEALAESR